MVGLMAVASGGATAQERPSDVKMARVSGANAFTDGKGMTLYVYDRDPPFRSTCVQVCASNWPPLTAPRDAGAQGQFTVIRRDDGSSQWAFRGKPLYRYGRDTRAGEAGGDGVANVWKVARP
jgi:predicted lipoprotein with Yx(FWY)xxD motif